jgi:uncharacterized membrane protein YdbT with pleckstrin-like domain
MLSLDTDESIILEVRKHWIVFVAQAIIHLLGAIAPFILFDIGVKFIPNLIPAQQNLKPLLSFFYFIWLGGLWASLFVAWTNYYLDVWYVTERRIIDVEQKRIFHREVSSIRFDKIQDITLEVKGIIATLLNYGDVRVQTASENSTNFVMNTAANPERVREMVFTQHNKQSERTQPVHIIEKW